MPNHFQCSICSRPAERLLRKTIGGVSVTSDSQYSTSLDPHLCFCTACNYWFTSQGNDLCEYFASEYNLLMHDFFADQRLFLSGRQVDRAEYQAELVSHLARKLGSQDLVEVGAGKGLTAFYVKRQVRPRSLALQDPGAGRYAMTWNHLVGPTSAHCSLDELDSVEFDLGYTFFSLEHTDQPVQDMITLMESLRPGAVFFGVVPWICVNPGDLLVGDHCSHFTRSSLGKLLDYCGTLTGTEYRILINYPLRALIYILSSSAQTVNDASSSMITGELAHDFSSSAPIVEVPDSELFAVAQRHWWVEADVATDKRDVLWGAGFYSKLIMLRHQEIRFAACIDANPSLTGTPFTDPGGLTMTVLASSTWLENASPSDRLWFGVSDSARASILSDNGAVLEKIGVRVAF